MNGVPLRRVNRRYVIATSTKVDVSAVNVEKLTDATFSKPKLTKSQAKTEAAFIETSKKEKTISAEFIAHQKAVDAAILSKLAKSDALMVKYLKAKFTLSNGVFPHELKF